MSAVRDRQAARRKAPPRPRGPQAPVRARRARAPVSAGRARIRSGWARVGAPARARTRLVDLMSSLSIAIRAARSRASARRASSSRSWLSSRIWRSASSAAAARRSLSSSLPPEAAGSSWRPAGARGGRGPLAPTTRPGGTRRPAGPWAWTACEASRATHCSQAHPRRTQCGRDGGGIRSYTGARAVDLTRHRGPDSELGGYRLDALLARSAPSLLFRARGIEAGEEVLIEVPRGGLRDAEGFAEQMRATAVKAAGAPAPPRGPDLRDRRRGRSPVSPSAPTPTASS